MDKWEYLSLSDQPDILDKSTLDSYGEEGWELVSVVSYTATRTVHESYRTYEEQTLGYVFKRRKQ